MENRNTLIATIRKRETILFTGEIKALTSINERGRFDVLPGHENFISVVLEYLILTLPHGEEKRFELLTGVLRVQGTTIQVYLDVTKAER